MERSAIKRSGARRLGDDYQDVVALDVLVDWLEHPNHYEWVKVEADDAGFLDDVVALRRDGTLVAKQVKYATAADDDDDRLTWDWLLEKPAGRSKTKQSLLEKWASSHKSAMASAQRLEASLVTNRRPAPELASLLSPDGKLGFAQTESARRTTIIQQIGSESDARTFFEQFLFKLDQMSLTDWKEAVRQRFARCGGTVEGWANLNEELRRWVNYRDVPRADGTILLADIKQAARWYRLRSLPQGFDVPADFVLPSEDFHRNLIDRIATADSGCTVLYASPGAGKSTYVSRVYGDLMDRGTPVVRHHYYLSISDSDAAVRLDHRRAAESLMHDLQTDHAAAVGALADQNVAPDGQALRKWLEACGRHYVKEGTKGRLVVIIDGLDHVWRERSSVEELDHLLRYVFPVPDGVHLLLATQRVADSMLPRALVLAAPTERWLELPLLDTAAVQLWLDFHLADVNTDVSADDEDRKYQLAVALWRRSGGNPLHLRYTLGTIQERGLRLTDDIIASLPECHHDGIVGYYRSLWQALPELSKTVLHLLAIARFPWPLSGLHECLDEENRNVAQVSEAIKQVNHLLTADSLGLRPFHGSLLIFVEQQTDHATLNNLLRRQVANWLAVRAPEYWKWAFHWRLAAESGNVDLLINGPDRTWTVDAIAARRPMSDIHAILAKAIRLSLDHRRLGRAIRLSLLLGYALETHEGYHEAPPNLLYIRLAASTDAYSRPVIRANLSEFSKTEIALLAEAESAAKNYAAVNHCFDTIRERIWGHRRRHRNMSESEPVDELRPLLAVAALPHCTETIRIARFALRNRDRGLSAPVIGAFASQLRNRKRLDGLQELFRWRPSDSDRIDVGDKNLTGWSAAPATSGVWPST